MREIIMFGAGKMADVARGYMERDAVFRVAAHCVDPEWVTTESYHDRPLVSFSHIEKHYPPDKYDMFVALGYHAMNKIRTERCMEARKKGYRLVSYVSPNSWPGPDHLNPGDNSLILDNATIQPGASLGENIAVWSSVVVGHHSRIDDNVWIAAGSMIGGSVTLGENCFLGLSVTVGHEVTVGKRCFLGAGSLILKNAEPNGVYLSNSDERYRLDIDAFLRITRMT